MPNHTARKTVVKKAPATRVARKPVAKAAKAPTSGPPAVLQRSADAVKASALRVARAAEELARAAARKASQVTGPRGSKATGHIGEEEAVSRGGPKAGAPKAKPVGKVEAYGGARATGGAVKKGRAAAGAKPAAEKAKIKKATAPRAVKTSGRLRTKERPKAEVSAQEATPADRVRIPVAVNATDAGDGTAGSNANSVTPRATPTKKVEAPGAVNAMDRAHAEDEMLGLEETDVTPNTTPADEVTSLEAPAGAGVEASTVPETGSAAMPASRALEAAAAPVPAPLTPAPSPVRKRPLHRSRLGTWAPLAVPAPHIGKPGDPRLAAAIAARERWHGRSGRPALKSATQAVAFARERRLVQLLDPSPLPNLLDPIVGKSCSPEERLEGPTAAVFSGWRKEFEVAHDLLQLRLAFERPTLVQAELWPSLVSVAGPREAAARSGALPLPREAEEALEILDRKGIVPIERLRSLLGLAPEELEHLRGLLESNLLVLARGVVDEEDGPTTILEPIGRWAARAVGSRRHEPHQAFTLLFAAALRSAAVLWPGEIASLFPWTPAERDAALSACLAAGAVVTYDEGDSIAYVASPVPR